MSLRSQSFLFLSIGLNIWEYWLLDTDPVPGSLRYRVLKESGGRCANCGATKKERPLDVDHIIPRSKGGRNVYENLQVLCSLCSQEKGNKDRSACPADVPLDSVSDCKFCYQSIKGRILEESAAAVAIKDRYPVTEGYTLVIPKRHAPEYFNLSNLERGDVGLLKVMKQHLFATDPSITGYNIGINNGASAGQTIFHFHLIPRRNGDTGNPGAALGV